MILEKALFKARLTEHPQQKIQDKETKKITFEDLGKFTPGNEYRIWAIFDGGDFTDFLVTDDEGRFFWLKMDIFRKR